MKLTEYFKRSDTPRENSPVGRMMVAILAESPELTPEEARQLAHFQLDKAAGRKNYRVTTPKQDRESIERFKRRVNAAPESGKNGLSEEQS